MRAWAVLLALLGVAPAASAHPIDAWMTRCQQKQLASYYGVSKGKLRRMVKRGMAVGDKSFLDGLDASSKTPARCRFAETGLTPEDAALLAQAWGTDPATAKGMVEEKFAMGYGDGVWWSLYSAKKAEWKGDAEPDVDEGEGEGEEDVDEGYPTDEELFGLFFDSGRYHYCDARMLADAWGADDIAGMKLTIGLKIHEGWEDALAGSLDEARRGAIARGEPCDWSELFYSTDDAERLASLWNVSVDTAKARAADLVGHGREADVRGLLGR